MSMSWKSYLFAFFAIALVSQISADIPEDVKIKTTSGLKNTTFINAAEAKQIFAQFTLTSNNGKLYKVKEATLSKGKWWLGAMGQQVTEYVINSVTFQYTPLTIGVSEIAASDEGVEGSFKIKTESGTPAMKVDFKVKEGEQTQITMSEKTSCYESRPGPEFHVYTITCD